jgi:hypothetical protein
VTKEELQRLHDAVIDDAQRCEELVAGYGPNGPEEWLELEVKAASLVVNVRLYREAVKADIEPEATRDRE